MDDDVYDNFNDSKNVQKFRILDDILDLPMYVHLMTGVQKSNHQPKRRAKTKISIKIETDFTIPRDEEDSDECFGHYDHMKVQNLSRDSKKEKKRELDPETISHSTLPYTKEQASNQFL